jgi:uncharacterized protein (TIGR02246 family)
MTSSEDTAAIVALITRFSHGLDSRDWTAYADTFTEDAVFEIFGQRRVGRADIAAGPARDLVRFDRTQHFNTNHMVEVDGDAAVARCSLLAVHIPDATQPDQHADVGAVYHYDCVREADGWRFRHVRLEILWTAGIPFGPA